MTNTYYDVNVFRYVGDEPYYESIQPSVILEQDNGSSTRIYYKSFPLTIGEGVWLWDMFEPDLGEDFFWDLTDFVKQEIPERIKVILNQLPKYDPQVLQYDKGEILWEHGKED